MPRVPSPRCYTTPANEIDLRAIRAAATQFRRQSSRFGRVGVARQGRSIRQCISDAVELAMNELTVRQDDIALSSAADIVDAVILSLGRSGYDSYGRELAILAYRAGRPCVLALGIYDQPANMGADAINSGAADMRDWLGERGRAIAPREFAASSVDRDALRAVNAAGARLIDAVRSAQRVMPEAAE